ncbi:MAG: dipeptide epimerase [Ignavibacteriales bacterium]|nr:dipeptide epimerase [Ignavibacteriales bacterium]
MQLSFYRYNLQLKHPFTIARGTRTVEPVVIVKLEHGDITGYGEAAPSSRYGENENTVEAFLRKIDLMNFTDPFQLESILDYADRIAAGNYSAKAALDIALHDWLGKAMNVPLYKYWGLDKNKTPLTSFTIGIDTPDVIEKKVREAEEYPLLKIKLGGDNDEEIMRTIRQVTKKTLRVDANEGWKTKEIALQKIQLMNSYDGINIKLMKCTGLREAMRMVATARACGMKIMVGCMIETSVAISAAAQFSPLIDYADLDGSVLTTNDPFEGVTILNGKLELPDRPGIGVKPKD